MEQTTARLRRTFRSKVDDNDSDDSLPEALDEEEQESLIASLHTQNAICNTQYATALLALALLCTLAYAAPLLRSGSGSGVRVRVLSLLSISSLLASAHGLYFLAAEAAAEGEGEGKRGERGWQRGSGSASAGRVEKGPLRSYLPYLNAVLVALLAVAGFAGGQQGEKGGQGGEGVWFALLPGLVCGVVAVAKGIMGSVDVGQLEGLKYGYKGA